MKQLLWVVISLAILVSSAQSKSVTEKKVDKNNSKEGNNVGESKCYDELGCVEITEEFYDPTHRPLNFLPMDRDKVNTRFILYTRKNPTENVGQYLVAGDDASITMSHFNASKQTKLIVHGFIDTGFVNWITEMAQTLLAYEDMNVIAVDWGGGSLPLYGQATGNTRLVGLEIGYLVNYLKGKFGLNPSNVHIIGHSLGAHTAGYAGEQIEGLGRITGLDPAEPYFQYMPAHVKLDPNDANFVDVIHTDGRTILLLGYGMIEATGHLDFYPNSGKNQPGCSPVTVPLDMITEGMLAGGRELVACGHQRAIKFFTESILSGCEMVGYECFSYDEFLQGKCGTCGSDNSHCAMLGLRATEYPLADRNLIPLYFDTEADTPFCIYHYSVTIETAHPANAEDTLEGLLSLNIEGERFSIPDVDLTPKGRITIAQGTTLTFLFTSRLDTGKITSIELNWNYKDGLGLCGLFCNDRLYVAYIEVSPLDYYPENLRLEHTMKGCNPDGWSYTEIADKHSAKFVSCAETKHRQHVNRGKIEDAKKKKID